jgi:hypothetical protein
MLSLSQVSFNIEQQVSFFKLVSLFFHLLFIRIEVDDEKINYHFILFLADFVQLPLAIDGLHTPSVN